MPSNCGGEVQARTGITGWYQVPARTRHYLSRHPVGTLWAPCGQTYVEVRDDHLYNTAENEYINVVVIARYTWYIFDTWYQV